MQKGKFYHVYGILRIKLKSFLTSALDRGDWLISGSRTFTCGHRTGSVGLREGSEEKIPKSFSDNSAYNHSVSELSRNDDEAHYTHLIKIWADFSFNYHQVIHIHIYLPIYCWI
jgi:hypothetical protein